MEGRDFVLDSARGARQGTAALPEVGTGWGRGERTPHPDAAHITHHA